MNLNPNVVDFADRVGATVGQAALAVYIADPHAATAKPAAVAGLLAGAKFLYMKLSAWQAAHAIPQTSAITVNVSNTPEPVVDPAVPV